MIVCECVRECRARWWRFQVAIKINCHGVGVCLFYRSIEHGQVSGQCNEGIWLSGCGLSWLTIRLSRLLLATCSQRANFSDIIFNWATTHTFFAAPCAPRVMHHAERRQNTHTHALICSWRGRLTTFLSLANCPIAFCNESEWTRKLLTLWLSPNAINVINGSAGERQYIEKLIEKFLPGNVSHKIFLASHAVWFFDWPYS